MHMLTGIMSAFARHQLYVVTLIVAALLSSTQLVLIFGINRSGTPALFKGPLVKFRSLRCRLCNRDWGIDDFVFAAGDEVVNDVAQFVLQMPMMVMCARLCPGGVESTV